MKKSSSTVCVLGLGYIGLPTASMFATHGYKVLGVDVNSQIVKTLQKGSIHIEEPGLATVVKAAISSQNLTISTKPAAADIFIIAVPTPDQPGKGGIPTADMSYVKSALDSILPILKKGDIVVLESTSPPGTTRDIIIPMIKEKTNLIPGKDVGVAYCPERVIPGQALKELIGNDRVVGGITEKWAKTVKKHYKSFVAGEIFLTEPTVAEMVKILENTYRDVNIALANEVAQICEKLKISVWDVIQLANRHPRVNIHNPGPGVGGHCISVDPWFLVEKFPDLAKLIHLSRNVNDSMPQYVARVAQKLLEGQSKPKVTILGLAYKGNVDDDRESPSYEVIKSLKKNIKGIQVRVYDPHVHSKEFPDDGIEKAFQNSNLAILLTPHEEYKFLDPEQIGDLMKNRIILDTHNFLKSQRWIPAGFKLYTLGTETTSSEQRVSRQ